MAQAATVGQNLRVSLHGKLFKQGQGNNVSSIRSPKTSSIFSKQPKLTVMGRTMVSRSKWNRRLFPHRRENESIRIIRRRKPQTLQKG